MVIKTNGELYYSSLIYDLLVSVLWPDPNASRAPLPPPTFALAVAPPTPPHQRHPHNATAHLPPLSCPKNATAHLPAPSPSLQLMPHQHCIMPSQQPFHLRRRHPDNAVAPPPLTLPPFPLPPLHLLPPRQPQPTTSAQQRCSTSAAALTHPPQCRHCATDNHHTTKTPQNIHANRVMQAERCKLSRAMGAKRRKPSKASASAEVPAPLPMPLHHQHLSAIEASMMRHYSRPTDAPPPPPQRCTAANALPLLSPPCPATAPQTTLLLQWHCHFVCAMVGQGVGQIIWQSAWGPRTFFFLKMKLIQLNVFILFWTAIILTVGLIVGTRVTVWSEIQNK